MSEYREAVRQAFASALSNLIIQIFIDLSGGMGEEAAEATFENGLRYLIIARTIALSKEPSL